MRNKKMMMAAVLLMSFVFLAGVAWSQTLWDDALEGKITKLEKARAEANESAAVAALHTIVAAEKQYLFSSPEYASLETLGSARPPYIDSKLAQGKKLGYSYTVTTNKGKNFFAVAVPESSENHTLYIDEDGTVCRSKALKAAAPTKHIDDGCPAGFRRITGSALEK